MIKEDVVLGKNVKIFNPDLVNLYGCKLGDNVTVGAFVEIRKGVKIGNNVKIQAFVFIPEGMTIEDDVFIGPHVCFTNDKYPRSTTEQGKLSTEEDWQHEKTLVKKGASIGANATILCGITVGEKAIVGCGSVVTKDVPPNVIVAGNPARVLRKL
jgi:acetyltransferase-like isoleucine patch superfamily enzyme